MVGKAFWKSISKSAQFSTHRFGYSLWSPNKALLRSQFRSILRIARARLQITWCFEYIRGLCPFTTEAMAERAQFMYNTFPCLIALVVSAGCANFTHFPMANARAMLLRWCTVGGFTCTVWRQWKPRTRNHNVELTRHCARNKLSCTRNGDERYKSAASRGVCACAYSHVATSSLCQELAGEAQRCLKKHGWSAAGSREVSHYARHVVLVLRVQTGLRVPQKRECGLKSEIRERSGYVIIANAKQRLFWSCVNKLFWTNNVKRKMWWRQED